MTIEEKVASAMILSVVIGVIAIAIAYTICSEVIKNGNAKRCAEYGYNCPKGEE